MDNATLWLTPLVLLPGVALLIMSTSIRYGQLHEEVHTLLEKKQPSSELKRIFSHLLTRAVLFRNALVALYVAVVLFAIASLIGGLGDLISIDFIWGVIILISLGIISLLFAAIELVRESVTSLNILREHEQKIDNRVI